MSEKYPCPDSLGEVGTALWEKIVADYDLRADELTTLEDACAASDTVAILDKMWRELGRPVITTGSMGQEVEHPLIGSIDKQRKSRNALWRQLKLPDLDADSPSQNQNRDAANASWQPGVRGRGA
jgi:hypothetical protein